MCTIAAKYRLHFEFFSTIRTFHLRLPAYFLIVACYVRNYEYCHRRAVAACTIMHITAETVRYGGVEWLRFGGRLYRHQGVSGRLPETGGADLVGDLLGQLLRRLL